MGAATSSARRRGLTRGRGHPRGPMGVTKTGAWSGRAGPRKCEPPPPPRAPPPPRPRPRLLVPSFPGSRATAADWRIGWPAAPSPRWLPRRRLPFVFPGGDERRTRAEAAGTRTPALLATSRASGRKPAECVLPGPGHGLSRSRARAARSLRPPPPRVALFSAPGTVAGHHGQAEQQAAARGAAGPARKHRVHRPRAAGVVQGLPQGLPHRPPDRGRVQEDLRQLLPLWRRLQVRRARLPHLRHQQRRHHRLPGVHHRAERDFAGEAGAEAEVGLQHVRPGRQRLHQPQRDAGDRAGHLQNGVICDEDARGRVHPREADGQDLQTDGHEQ